MLNNIKKLLGLSTNDKDEIITLLISQASDEARTYTHNNDLNGLSQTIIQMVIYNYNRLGTEGLSSEGYSGVTYSYTPDYPDAILRQLKAHRKVRIV